MNRRGAGALKRPFYRPEQWSAAESFVYKASSPLLSAETRLEFRKTSETFARLVASTEIRLPLRKRMEFQASTEFSTETKGPCLFHAFTERALDGSLFRQTQALGDHVSVTERKNGHDAQTRRTDFDLNGIRLSNPLMTFIELRDYYASGNVSSGYLSPVIVSSRVYSIFFEARAELDGRKRLHLQRGHQEGSAPEEKIIEIEWDFERAAPKLFCVPVPVLGSIDLRLFAHEKLGN